MRFPFLSLHVPSHIKTQNTSTCLAYFISECLPLVVRCTIVCVCVCVCMCVCVCVLCVYTYTSGRGHTGAMLDDGSRRGLLKCFGWNVNGKLGLGRADSAVGTLKCALGYN